MYMSYLWNSHRALQIQRLRLHVPNFARLLLMNNCVSREVTQVTMKHGSWYLILTCKSSGITSSLWKIEVGWNSVLLICQVTCAHQSENLMIKHHNSAVVLGLFNIPVNEHWSFPHFMGVLWCCVSWDWMNLKPVTLVQYIE